MRVYHNNVTRFFKTGIDLSIEDFNRSYLSQKPRQEYRPIKDKIAGIEARAKGIAEGLKTFNLKRFEKILLRATGAGVNVFHHYKQVVESLAKQDRIGTASNYDLSAKSIKLFLKGKGKE